MSENIEVNNRFTQPRQETVQQRKQKAGYLKQKWFAFGCLTALIIFFITIIIVLYSFASIGKRKPVAVLPNTYLNLVITGNIQEHRELDEDFFSFDSRKTLSIRDIIEKIDGAATDERISGLIIEPRFLSVGYPSLNELIKSLENFKSQGKYIYAYLEMASNRDYFLASVADKVYLNPSNSSGIFLSGVGISSLYMKDLLDKLGVEMTVIHSGDYKGAGENFSRNEMSPEIRENYHLIIDNTYEQMLTDISYRRDMNIEALRQIYETREDVFVNGSYALENGIVDGLIDRDGIIQQLGLEEKRIMSLRRYTPRQLPSKSPNKIAVVYLQGTISMSTGGLTQNVLSAEKVTKIIDDLEKDSTVRGVVLRVISPGGSALESEKIYHNLVELNDKLPVVVSMGDVAASGGYYIAAPVEYIIADPYTLTGSIGVVAMIPNLHGTGKSIGVNPQTMYRGKFTNFLNPWETPKRADITALQRGLDATYSEFKQRVAEGRNFTDAELEPIAQGKVWTSRHALQNGLIDEIGTIDDAIRKVAELSGVSEYEVIYLPKMRSIVDLFLERQFNLNEATDLLKGSIMSELGLQEVQQLIDIAENNPILMLSPASTID